MTQQRTRTFGRRSFLATGTSIAVASIAGCQTSEDSGGSDGQSTGNGQSTSEETQGGTAATTSSSGSDPLKIGVLAPSPENNPNGRGMANGARLAGDRLNANGGVLGSDVEVIVKNTKGNAGTAREAYQDLTLGEGVDLTTGVMSAEVLMSLMDAIANQETLHITSGAITPGASAMVAEDYETYKYHFRSSLNGILLGRGLEDFVTDVFPQQGWTDVAMLGMDSEDVTPLQNGVAGWFEEQDFNLVYNESFSPGTQNFNPLFDQVEESGADVLLPMMVTPGSTAAIVQWANGERPFEFAGIHTPSQSPTFYEETDGAAAHTVTSNISSPQAEYSQKTQPFIAEYGERFGKAPVFTGFTTGGAIGMWAEALTQAGTRDVEELITTLESTSYTSVQGLMEFYAPDHQFAHDLKYQLGQGVPIFTQWQPNADDSSQGTQEVIYPEEFRTAEYQSPPWIN